MADGSFTHRALVGNPELLGKFLDRAVFAAKQKIESVQNQMQQVRSALNEELNTLAWLQAQLAQLGKTLQAEQAENPGLEPNHKLPPQPQVSVVKWIQPGEPLRTEHLKTEGPEVHKGAPEQQRIDSLQKENEELRSALLQESNVKGLLQSQVSNLKGALQKTHPGTFRPPATRR